MQKANETLEHDYPGSLVGFFEGYVRRDRVHRDVVEQTRVEKGYTVEIKGFFGGRRLVIIVRRGSVGEGSEIGELECNDRNPASCVFMLELNFHSGSSIYSTQWFACLASHTSRSDSPVAHPSSSSCRGSETSGLAMLLVRACGAETFIPWTLLERAEASCVFMLELNFHSGSSIYSSHWFACLASHTSRSDSPVAHPIAGGDGCYNLVSERGSVPALTWDGDLWDLDFSDFQCLGIGRFCGKKMTPFGPISFGFDGNKRKNTINVTNQIASHHRRHVLHRSPPHPSLLMSMEPSLLLLALYSGDELRRGGETSDGAAASNHLATVTDLLDH
ncbi:hypothetical protein F2Q69_00022618 [Brassica cretica]|uniref:Uncharacterized protein n=1 Tax=Brassica cretica TaxID=69181 RepID=A0A8S9QF12_BRACR|nr:hypothetical protein F2Q69_00022618 [Brassica cretica]